MKSFHSRPYQLQESKKWIPAGTISQLIDNSSSVKMTEVEIHEKQFTTMEEAHKFFVNYYTSKGYIENQ